MMKTMFISYTQMNFRNQVLIGAGAGLVAYYGPKKFVEKGKEAVDFVAELSPFAGPGIAPLAGVVGYVIINGNYFNKKRKL